MMPHHWERVPLDPDFVQGLLPRVPKWACSRCGSRVATFRLPSAEGFETWAQDGISNDCDEMLTQNLLDS